MRTSVTLTPPVLCRTGNVICTVSVSVMDQTLRKILRSSASDDDSELFIIRYQDNTVFATSVDDPIQLQKITDTGYVSKEILDQLRQGLDYSGRSVDVIVSDSKSFAAYPLSPLSEHHSETDKPEYLLIRAIPNNVFHYPNLENSIHKEVTEICIVTFSIGIAGVALVLVVVWLVSRSLTEPLLWIKRVAWNVINQSEEQSNFTQLNKKSEPTLAVKTEVNELVKEFKDMFLNFSGTSAAKAVDVELFEIKNHFKWVADYRHFFSAIRDPNFSEIDVTKRLEEEALLCLSKTYETEVEGNPLNQRKNRGENCNSASFKVPQNHGTLDNHANRSYLFMWILCLIIVPFLLTNATICAVVSDRIINSLGNLVLSVGLESNGLEIKALRSRTALSAAMAEFSFESKIRDLFIATRIAGWIFFDGVSRSTSFTEIEESVSDCQAFDIGFCQLQSDFERFPCACEWEDLRGDDCREVNHTDP